MADLPPRQPPRLAENSDSLGQLLKSAQDGSAATRLGSRERVWRNITGAPKTRRVRGLIPAVAACAALVLVLLLSPIVAPQQFATLVLSAGDVQASTATQASWTAPRVGEALLEGSRLRTAVNSQAFTRLPTGGVLFGEGTRASLDRNRQGIEVRLEHGSATLAASKGWLVQAEPFTVEVTDALFEVKVGSEAIVEVCVYDGSARVRGESVDLELHAGESWSSRSGRARRTIEPSEVATTRALLTANTAEAVLRITGPAGAAITLDGVRLGAAPLTVLERVGAHEVVAARYGTRSTATVNLAAEGGLFEATEPLPALTAPAEKPQALKPGEADAVAPLQQKLKDRLSETERASASYELARLLSRRGRHAEAIVLYEKLASGTGSWAESALYEVGRLRLRHLGDAPGSLRAFAEYRARYPSGALMHEVALSAIEAQLAKPDSEAALREIDLFLSAFPASERVPDVRILRATLLRDRGDCVGALGDYLLLVKAGKHDDDALYFAAYCEQQNADPAAARRHLSEYVIRFPAGRHASEAKAALGR
jgi:tetratricopeptide (TPR) repeat protein